MANDMGCPEQTIRSGLVQSVELTPPCGCGLGVNNKPGPGRPYELVKVQTGMGMVGSIYEPVDVAPAGRTRNLSYSSGGTAYCRAVQVPMV
eukprot:scaffold24982_cov65-Attheya_sp.AAC.3